MYIAHHPWIDISVLSGLHHNPISYVLDDEGDLLYSFQRDQREQAPLSTIPRHVQNAFIATEDRQFYHHVGLSWVGIIRSLIYNMYYGRRAQGASTITQQLVRLLFFDQQKTFSRKLKEQFLTLIVEQQFSKEQILELYLNNVYFGCGIYGVSSAAHHFFGKHIMELTIEEGATLAGIVRSPARYCPLTHPDRAEKRRNMVLFLMHTAHYISQNEMYELQKKPFCLTNSPHTNSSHLKELIRQTIEEQFGRTALYTQGLCIKTTINKKMQAAAEQIFHAHVSTLRQHFKVPIDGALVCLETKTGAIKALIGGYEYQESQFNRAYAHRQLGSTFKPIIYAAALEHGMHLHDVVEDIPLSIEGNGTLWQPRNVNRQFVGPVTRAYALSTSNNIIAIKTLLELGIEPCISYAHKCGITETIAPYPSLALGCIDVTILQTAGMFNVLVNQGIYVDPYYISWVKSSEGKIIWAHHPKQTAVFSWTTCSAITSILCHVTQRWEHALELPVLSCENMGKTGTTNDARTCRFSGSTPSWTTAVYLGADNNQPITDMHSTRTAFPLWHAFNAAIPQPKAQFEYAPTTRPVYMHRITGEYLDSPTTETMTIHIPIS